MQQIETPISRCYHNSINSSLAEVHICGDFMVYSNGFIWEIKICLAITRAEIWKESKSEDEGEGGLGEECERR